MDIINSTNNIIKQTLSNNNNNYSATLIRLSKALLLSGVILYLGIILFSSHQQKLSLFFNQEQALHEPSNPNPTPTSTPTNLSHLFFGLLGSESAYHYRKAYIESWWRAGKTRGFLYLETSPIGDLLPWSKASPPFRVSKNISSFIEEIHAVTPIQTRLVHSILELLREDNQGFRWLVLGDDDSIFFVDNMVDVLSKYDHTKYYYFGTPSDFVLSNFWFSFIQAFGGAGIIMSYPLAIALANDMESCLRRTSQLNSADLITFACISDIGVNMIPLQGSHQIDLHGDISGLLSAHPKVPLISLHHLDTIEPIFPGKNRSEAISHLFEGAEYDQSRLLQQTICHHRENSWTLSTSWGYSINLYEKIMPRWWIQYPLQTFQPWFELGRKPPHYMFNTRIPSGDPCEAPHVYFFKSVDPISENSTTIRTVYFRDKPRDLPPCMINGNHTADDVNEIEVFSPARKRTQIDRCECCDIDYEEGMKTVRIKYRECLWGEILA